MKSLTYLLEHNTILNMLPPIPPLFVCKNLLLYSFIYIAIYTLVMNDFLKALFLPQKQGVIHQMRCFLQYLSLLNLTNPKCPSPRPCIAYP